MLQSCLPHLTFFSIPRALNDMQHVAEYVDAGLMLVDDPDDALRLFLLIYSIISWNSTFQWETFYTQSHSSIYVTDQVFIHYSSSKFKKKKKKKKKNPLNAAGMI